jgi:ABC-2 type transport system permease protein
VTLDVAAFEAGRRSRGAVLTSVVVGALVGLVVSIYPSISRADIDYEAYVEALPEQFQTAFGASGGLGTIEGFLVTELYGFVWLLILGGYFAYVAAGLIAGDARDGSLELLLVNPVSRSRVAVEKFLGLLPGVVFVNAVGLLAVVGFAAAVGERVSVEPLFALHALFVLYHAACAGLGLFASAATTQRRAQVLSVGALFATVVVDSVTVDTDYEWAGALSLSRHFDPAEILVEETVSWPEMGGFVVLTLALVVLAAETFERRDVG